MLFLRTIAKIFTLPLGLLVKLLRKNTELSILMYHRVNDGVNKELSVKEKDFAWQMRYLVKKGYHMFTMDEAVRAIREGLLKPKSVVITFDDGYKDYIEEAYPVLKSYGIPSLMYLVSGYIDSGETFWWDEDIGESDLLSWEDIKRLKDDSTVSFGSHTCRHFDLDALEYDEVYDELLESKSALVKKLDTPIEHFAYPRGRYSKEGEEIAKGLYKTAVLITKDGSDQWTEENLHRMKRLPVQRSDGRFLFVARLKGWLVIEEWIREYIAR